MCCPKCEKEKITLCKICNLEYKKSPSIQDIAKEMRNKIRKIKRNYGGLVYIITSAKELAELLNDARYWAKDHTCKIYLYKTHPELGFPEYKYGYFWSKLIDSQSGTRVGEVYPGGRTVVMDKYLLDFIPKVKEIK